MRLITRQRSATLVRAFNFYLDWYFSRNFHGLRVLKKTRLNNYPRQALIIYTNHPSWWDPLTFFVLASKVFFSHISFGVMDSIALEHYRFMKRLGVFGVNPRSFSSIRSFLSIGASLLDIPSHCIWITAQGEFSDVRNYPVRLQRGISLLAKQSPKALIIPLAMEYTFWDERFPEALVAFGEPIEALNIHRLNANEITIRLEQHLNDCISDLQENSILRDETLFETIIDGNYGIGGFYDATRRLQAKLAGKTYRPKHSDIKKP